MKDNETEAWHVVVLMAAIAVVVFFAVFFWLEFGLDTLVISESKPGEAGENLAGLTMMLAGVVAAFVAFLINGVGGVEAAGNVAGTASFAGAVGTIGLSSGNNLIALIGVLAIAMMAVSLVVNDPATQGLEKFFSKGRLTVYFGAEFIFVLAPMVWLAVRLT